jgi:mannose-1-phosphate guanylyltransferase/mannose-6-phosphate isomerase
MKNVVFLILCGGGGERLWPLSRKNRPKQFISFLDGKSLLEQSLDRIFPLAENKSNIGVVTSDKQKKLLLDLVGNKIGFVLDEPAQRNTAPAILYSCLKIYEKNPDAVVVFLPADSFVVDNQKYINYLSQAIECAACNDKIVTLGLMPTRPATCYGYIQADSNFSNCIDCGKLYEVLTFHEKPDVQTAKKYMQQGDMFWNIGVFAAKISVFLNEFKACSSQLFFDMQNFMEGKISYQDLPNISIDYAVMEKSKNISVLVSDFEWDDIGNLDVFLTFQKRFSQDSTKIINIDGEKNLVKVLSEEGHNAKLVAFVGVSDLCLVQEKDIILVAKRDEIEKVKKVLAKIREESLENFL